MSEKMSLYQFYTEAAAHQPNLRRPQAMFNLLSAKRPDLAEKVVGTDKDPYYCQGMGNSNFPRFIEFIETNW